MKRNIINGKSIYFQILWLISLIGRGELDGVFDEVGDGGRVADVALVDELLVEHVPDAASTASHSLHRKQSQTTLVKPFSLSRQTPSHFSF